jgi:hypothetical protein
MTFASPWFGPIYLTAFAAALGAVTFARRLTPSVTVALAGYAAVVAALCGGLALRGTRYDVSGEPQLALRPIAVAVAVPSTLGTPSGTDFDLSVDALATADGHGTASSSLEVKRGGTAVIDGWAYDGPERARCSAVAAVVDRRPFVGTYGAERPDVAAARGQDYRFTGYHIVVPTATIGRGWHRLSVRCLDAAGRSYEAARTYTLEVLP